MAACIAAYVAIEYGNVLHDPFVGDDYIFLEKVRGASPLSLVSFRALAFHYYRPWSRELHYWLGTHLFGVRPEPFHVLSLALIATSGVLAFALARRLLGTARAAFATAGILALAAWGATAAWAACAQDLWMIVFALGTLLAFAAGRRALATACLVLALLSKETAAVVPVIAIAWGTLVERRPLRGEVMRAWPLIVPVAVWACVHPLLGGRLIHPLHETTLAGLHPPTTRILGRTLLGVLNLDAWPKPEHGWISIRGALGALALVAIVALGVRGRGDAREEPDAPRRRHVAVFGSTWCLLGWLPLLMPSLGWHPYYGLFGMIGAWIAITALVAPRPAIAITVVAALAVLSSARATTPSFDWGTEWFQRRAAWFGEASRQQIQAEVPRVRPHARFYLTNVPHGAGLIPSGDESPAMRGWYGDPTLEAHFLSRYRPRPSGMPGDDYFFTYEPDRGWQRIVTGPEDLGSRSRADTTWLTEHWRLASTFLTAQDWTAAAPELEKLATVAPERPEFAFDLGVVLERLGDRERAAAWLNRAATLPSATPEMRELASRAVHPPP